MEELSAVEDVVRVVFPSTMMSEGELLPAAFKLRDYNGVAEQYISVFRQYAETFNADVLKFDKSRNLPCCILNVGELKNIVLKLNGLYVKYDVKAVPTTVYPSHAGIYVCLGGKPIEGNGHGACTALGIGKDADFILLAIRRRLIDIAKKRVTTVSQLVTES